MGLGALALIAGGQAYGAYTAYGERKEESKLAKYNALVKESEAKSIEAKTGFDLMRAAEEGERIEQTQLTNIEGVSSLGAGLLAQAVQAAENERRKTVIGFEGTTAAERARTEGKIYRAQSKYIRKVGRQELLGNIIGTSGTLLQGLYKPKPPTTDMTRTGTAIKGFPSGRYGMGY